MWLHGVFGEKPTCHQNVSCEIIRDDDDDDKEKALKIFCEMRFPLERLDVGKPAGIVTSTHSSCWINNRVALAHHSAYQFFNSCITVTYCLCMRTVCERPRLSDYSELTFLIHPFLLQFEFLYGTIRSGHLKSSAWHQCSTSLYSHRYNKRESSLTRSLRSDQILKQNKSHMIVL